MTVPVRASQPRVLGKLKVLELNSWYFSGTIINEAGSPVPKASVTAFVLNIIDNESGAAIVSARNILDANGGTYHATTGAFTLTSPGADQAIQDTDLDAGDDEKHTARLTLTWSGGGRWDGEIELEVEKFTEATS